MVKTYSDCQSYRQSTNKNFFPAALLLIFPAMLQATAIYKWIDENGDIHYSDTPQDQLAKKIAIRPEPDTKEIEQAKQREKILRNAAEDLQKNRKQREIRQLEAERIKRTQQQKKEQKTQAQKKKKEARESRSEGHYQKHWQRQLLPSILSYKQSVSGGRE